MKILISFSLFKLPDSIITGSLNLPGVNPNALTNQGGNIPYNQMTDVQKRAYYDQLFT